MAKVPDTTNLSRRSVLTGGIGAAISANAGALAAASFAAGASPFFEFHQAILRLSEEMEGGLGDDEIEEARFLERWREIDNRALATEASTMPDAIACLEYARREHVQFNMLDDEEADNFSSRLVLHLIDGALGVLRGFRVASA